MCQRSILKLAVSGRMTLSVRDLSQIKVKLFTADSSTRTQSCGSCPYAWRDLVTIVIVTWAVRYLMVSIATPAVGSRISGQSWRYLRVQLSFTDLSQCTGDATDSIVTMQRHLTERCAGCNHSVSVIAVWKMKRIPSHLADEQAPPRITPCLHPEQKNERETILKRTDPTQLTANQSRKSCRYLMFLGWMAWG